MTAIIHMVLSYHQHNSLTAQMEEKLNSLKKTQTQTISFRGLMLFTVCDSRHSWILAERARNKSTEIIPRSSWNSNLRIPVTIEPLGPLAKAAYVACLPLFCQRSKRLSGKSVRLVYFLKWIKNVTIAKEGGHHLDLDKVNWQLWWPVLSQNQLFYSFFYSPQVTEFSTPTA